MGSVALPAALSGTRMRCFVAIDLAPGVRDAIARAQAALRATAPGADVRWVAPAALHLTLGFLGAVDAARAAGVEAALATVAARHAPVALGARRIGAFPGVQRPRVVWAGITDGAAGVSVLAGAVADALVPLGFARDMRPFSAHVTLGRVRSPRGGAALTAALAAASVEPFGTWTAAEMVLYRSHLQPTGPVYEPLARLPLGAR